MVLPLIPFVPLCDESPAKSEAGSLLVLFPPISLPNRPQESRNYVLYAFFDLFSLGSFL